MKMRKTLINTARVAPYIAILVVGTVLSFLTLTFTNEQTASANYNGAHIIDNAVFIDSNGTPGSGSTMSRSQIQSFLSSKGSGLASRSFKLGCYGPDSKERQWFTSIGAPCDQTIKASHIIYWVGRIYGINPQVILATMQKEQSLITSPNPTSWQINNAMGYNCPTTGSCSSPGFFVQVDHGTWVLRYHYERARGNMTWWRNSSSWTCGSEKSFYKPNLYPGSNTRFYDGNGVHYRTYNLANPATSALYCYTPHAYNNPDGLFGLPQFGTKGQYYSGSYWFVTYFNRWFGSVYAKPLNFEPMSTPRWMELSSNVAKKNLRLGVEDNWVIGSGTQIYFKSKIDIDGVTYLRTEYDTVRGRPKGIPMTELQDVALDYVSMAEPREMRVKTNTHNKNPRTESNIESVPRGTRIQFDTKVQLGDKWFLRSEDDTQQDLHRGIPLSDLYEVIEYEQLDDPRWMQVKDKARKVDPQTGRKMAPLLEPGRQVFFDSKVAFKGEWYLRTELDTQRDGNQGVPLSNLKNLNLNYVSLAKPRWMQLARDAHKKDPERGSNVGSQISAGTPFYFRTKVGVGGEWYLRSSTDTNGNQNVGIPLSDLEEYESSYISLANPRKMTLSVDTKKQFLASGAKTGSVLKKGRQIYFSTKIALGGQWYLRSAYDTDRDSDLVIPLSRLR